MREGGGRIPRWEVGKTLQRMHWKGNAAIFPWKICPGRQVGMCLWLLPKDGSMTWVVWAPSNPLPGQEPPSSNPPQIPESQQGSQSSPRPFQKHLLGVDKPPEQHRDVSQQGGKAGRTGLEPPSLGRKGKDGFSRLPCEMQMSAPTAAVAPGTAMIYGKLHQRALFMWEAVEGL